MECPCEGKRRWLSDPCAPASSDFTHRTIPFVRVVHKTYTIRATLILDTGATTFNVPSLATKLDANRAKRSRLAPRSSSWLIVHRGSAPVRRGARLSFESQSAHRHRALRVLRIVNFDDSPRREPPAALHPPALQPLPLPVPATPAFARRIAIFLFLPIIFRLRRLRRLGLERWWPSSPPSPSSFAQVSLAFPSTQPTQDIRWPPKQQQQPLQWRRRRWRRRRCRLRRHATRPFASLLNTHLPFLILFKPTPNTAPRKARPRLFAPPAPSGQACPGYIPSLVAVRILEPER
jgi:hypothetical protein